MACIPGDPSILPIFRDPIEVHRPCVSPIHIMSPSRRRRRMFWGLPGLFRTATLILAPFTVPDGPSSTLSFPPSLLQSFGFFHAFTIFIISVLHASLHSLPLSLPCRWHHRRTPQPLSQALFSPAVRHPSISVAPAIHEGHLCVDAKLTQSVNPLDANFNGPVTTVPNADGTGSLLLDPTGTSLSKPTGSASFRVVADGSSTRSIPSPSPPPNSPTSAPSSNESSTGRVTHQVLVGVAAVLAVVILAALGLLFYLYWKRRRRTGAYRHE